MQTKRPSISLGHDGAPARILKKLRVETMHEPPPPNLHQEVSRSINAYQRIAKIGEGVYGVVFKARDRRTGETVAVKCLRAGETDLRAFLREADCLAMCRGHPSLVELKDTVRDDATGSMFLVMEYVGPSLKHVMDHERGGRPFSEAEVRRLMWQLLLGAKKMHSHNIIHRDLKPANILVNDKGELKICDFGMSRTMAALPPYSQPVVTLWYRAPELLLGTRNYDALVDMWSLGCVMAELLAGEPLFPGKTEMDQVSKVFEVIGTPNKKTWPSYALLPLASAACRRRKPYNCLREKFPAAAGFTGRPALSKAGFEVLNGLLTCNPDKRLTAAAALRHPWFAEAEAPAIARNALTLPAQKDAFKPKRRNACISWCPSFKY